MTPNRPDLESPETLLWQHIQQARWYAGKGRDAELVALHPLPWLTPPGGAGAVRLLVAEVGNRDGDAETHHYLLALSYHGADTTGDADSAIGRCADPELGEVVLHDATRDPLAQELLLAAVLGAGERSDDDARLVAEFVDGSEVSASLPPRIFGGEQSNTSIMYGEVAMLKLFRRLEIGDNLDIEIHRALADAPAAADVARLYGWLTAEWHDTGGASCRADAAMLVEQLREVSDGWQVAVAAAGSGDDFTGPAEELGRALRQVHEALATAFGTGNRTGAGAAEQMTRRLAAAVREVPALAAYQPGLAAIFGTLADTELDTQRVHGDFHLGQTLVGADGGWKIIDFEGEPLKTLDERREPDTGWRDVAGLLRSLDYAGGFAERSAGTDPAAARRWVQQSSDAFLRGYTAGRALTDAEHTVVAAYQADKAVYEVVYEARNRPDWLPIPLTELGALAEHRSTDDPPHHDREAAR
ncbi:phosphotransferase [Enemella evansiae]|uniref:Maltokinase n=1 Tax=Enemella evansiae TaxID=2016499 RepID=A0A255GEN3_9ACTN|nr:phosphotransferase [Enemella evansiae]OYO14327.1 phosphotransferase [Enemella evansiae]